MKFDYTNIRVWRKHRMIGSIGYVFRWTIGFLTVGFLTASFSAAFFCQFVLPKYFIIRRFHYEAWFANRHIIFTSFVAQANACQQFCAQDLQNCWQAFVCATKLVKILCLLANCINWRLHYEHCLTYSNMAGSIRIVSRQLVSCPMISLKFFFCQLIFCAVSFHIFCWPFSSDVSCVSRHLQRVRRTTL